MQTNNSKEKVRQLQNKLYLTAKKCDSRRFHALYDKVYRDDVLFEAWKRVKANKGSSGVDGIKIEDVEAMGIEKYLSEIVFECQIVQDIGRNTRKIKVDKTVYILEKLGFKWAPVGKKIYVSL